MREETNVATNQLVTALSTKWERSHPKKRGYVRDLHRTEPGAGLQIDGEGSIECQDLRIEINAIVWSKGINTGYPGSLNIRLGSQENRSKREGHIYAGMVMDYLEWEIIV